MVRLYFDMETFRPCKEDAFVNEKIISCGLLVDETPYHENSLKEKGELIPFSEWDGLDEWAIVQRFMNMLLRLTRSIDLRLSVDLIFCVLMYHY